MRIQFLVAATAAMMTSAISVQAQQAGSGGNMYPVTQLDQVWETVNRPCTQLEAGANIAASDCGHIPLDKVARAFFAQSEEGGD